MTSGLLFNDIEDTLASGVGGCRETSEVTRLIITALKLTEKQKISAVHFQLVAIQKQPTAIATAADIPIKPRYARSPRPPMRLAIHPKLQVNDAIAPTVPMPNESRYAIE